MERPSNTLALKVTAPKNGARFHFPKSRPIPGFPPSPEPDVMIILPAVKGMWTTGRFF